MATMKIILTMLVTCVLAWGCQADPYDTEAYENGVYGAVPKGDGPTGGAAGALGLPNSASCPITDLSELEGETDPATDPDPETDPATEPDPETDPVPETEVEDPCAEALADSPWAPVYDLELELVNLGDELRSPDSYPRPRVTSFGMGGSEYWQKWPGGQGPLFGYGGGSEQGRRCMAAAALRFQLLMADPPESMQELKANSNWSGSFFNWVDDYSNEESWGSARGARLWAWRTGLIKFISQTDRDGSCFLPTRSMMELLAEDCLRRAENSTGEIQGCQS